MWEPGSDPHRAYGGGTVWCSLPLMLWGRRDERGLRGRSQQVPVKDLQGWWVGQWAMDR